MNRIRHVAAGAVAAAVLGLAACGGAHPSAPHHARAAAVARPSCTQQWDTWASGPSLKPSRQMSADLKSVNGTSTSQAVSVIAKASFQAYRLEQWPDPKCADPHRYYMQALRDVVKAGEAATSGTNSLEDLVLALVPLKHANRLFREIHPPPGTGDR